MKQLMQLRYLEIVKVAVMLLMLIYPTAMLLVKGGMNGVFLLVLLLASVVWLIKPKGMISVEWQRDFTIYSLAMCSLSAAILISQINIQSFTAHPHDAASRYWLSIFVFILLLRLRLNVPSVLQISFPLAAITGALMAKDQGIVEGGRLGIETLDVIHFGDFELILGVISLGCINWSGRDHLALRALKLSGFVAGVYASIVSGTRGGWIAIPVFFVIYLYLIKFKFSTKLIVASVFAAFLVFAIAYFGSSMFHQRVNDLSNDVISFGGGNRDTSTGIRWQLYSAAKDIFMQHPVFGVGPERFSQELQPMLQAGKITELAAKLGRAEVHNEILSKMVGMGTFGLISILAIYFVPLKLFWKATRSTSQPVRQSAILGVMFVSGFIVFGLTVEILNLTMATAFYSFTVAALLAACYNTHHGEQIVAQQ